jgi:hypothetical protein
MKELTDLVPFPRNPNTHPENQISLLARIIQTQGWRSPIVVSKRSGYITKGHGRLEAAKLIFEVTGYSQVPVEYQDYANEAAEYSDIIADNRIAELSTMDMARVEELSLEIPDLDLMDIGYDLDFRNLGDSSDPPSGEEKYTKKVGSPNYTPTKENPPSLVECFSQSKTGQLIASIDSSSISDEVKSFLRAAAHRHTVFNYEQIAEYYAHADPLIQQLMEDSALVIIDFGKALEDGYVAMSEQVAQQYIKDSGI